VLFIDIVAYSKMSIDDQREAIEKLNQIVQSTDEFRKAESEKRLLKLATGDGMALIFYHSPEDLSELAARTSSYSRKTTTHPLHPRNPWSEKVFCVFRVTSGRISGCTSVNGQK
jgi:hypothetical protein